MKFFLHEYSMKKYAQKGNLWNDSRLFSQVIGYIGNTEDILKRLPRKIKELSLLCVESQKYVIEKNWFGVSDNNGVKMFNPTFPSFFPIKVYDININNKNNNFIKEDLIKKEETLIFNQLSSNMSCNQIKNINSNFMEDFNNKYNFLRKDNIQKDLFRLSGGSWGVKYKNNILFIGHMIVHLNNFDNEKVRNYINNHNETDIKRINLEQFFKKRDYGLKLFKQKLLYYNCFILLDNNLNFLKISDCFYLYNNEDTGINFSIGLTYNKDIVTISIGESDCKTVLIQLSDHNMIQLFDSKSDVKFISYGVNKFDSGIKNKKSRKRSNKKSRKRSNKKR